jgi:hypothetical protein
MKNLKLFYLLTLCALCLYVAIGPAQATSAGGVQIINTAASIGNTTGPLSWGGVPVWDFPGYGTSVRMGMDASCGLTAPCSGTVLFSFNVFNPANITISLRGTSSDLSATGTVAFYDGELGGETIQNWTVNDGALMMTSFTVPVPGGDGAYQGEFTFNLAANSELKVPIAGSLDFTTDAPSVPEPGSALLLGVGIAFVGFLRRKVHG